MHLAATMASVNKLAKVGISTLVNHSALVMAKADEEKYDLDKYRKRAMAQFEADDDDNYLDVDLEKPWGNGDRKLPNAAKVKKLCEGIIN